MLDSSGKRLPTPQFGHERKNAPGRLGSNPRSRAKADHKKALLINTGTNFISYRPDLLFEVKLAVRSPGVRNPQSATMPCRT